MLRHCIGANRRAVWHVVDLLAWQVEARAQLADTGDHTTGRLLSPNALNDRVMALARIAGSSSGNVFGAPTDCEVRAISS